MAIFNCTEPLALFVCSCRQKKALPIDLIVITAIVMYYSRQHKVSKRNSYPYQVLLVGSLKLHVLDAVFTYPQFSLFAILVRKWRKIPCINFIFAKLDFVHILDLGNLICGKEKTVLIITNQTAQVGTIRCLWQLYCINDPALISGNPITYHYWAHRSYINKNYFDVASKSLI